MTIQEALDRCLEDIALGNASADECLARYPQYASQLRPLLKTARRLETTNEVRPSRAFKSKLRKQLMGEAPKPRHRFFSLVNLVVWVIVILLVISVALWMSISFEVAGHSTRPPPLNYRPPAEQIGAALERQPAETVNMTAASSSGPEDKPSEPGALAVDAQSSIPQQVWQTNFSEHVSELPATTSSRSAIQSQVRNDEPGKSKSGIKRAEYSGDKKGILGFAGV